MRVCFALAFIVLIVVLATGVAAQDRIGVFFDSEAQTTEYQVQQYLEIVRIYVVALDLTAPVGGFEFCLSDPRLPPEVSVLEWRAGGLVRQCLDVADWYCFVVGCFDQSFLPAETMVLAEMRFMFFGEEKPWFQICPIATPWGIFHYIYFDDDGPTLVEFTPAADGGCATFNPQSVPVESQAFGAIKALY